MRAHHRAAVLSAAAASVLVVFSGFAQYRSFDGSGNNLNLPNLGVAGSPYIREASGAHYADGISAPNGANRPGARDISNALMSQGETSVPDARGLTAMIYTWGQFIDHDLNLRKDASPAQSFSLSIPAGDVWFDPSATGNQVMPMNRSAFDPATGTSALNPREQTNGVTAYLDASMIYGSSSARASWLRSGSGGQLKAAAAPTGAMLPKNDGSQTMDGIAGPSNSTNLFVAGDVRANEQIGITSLHTLFLREHNRQATLIARANPGWTDEQVYQKARSIVSGEVQAITYNEFLPALLGSGAMGAYTGYDSSVNPGASNAFAAVAFRVGHSMLDDDIERVGPDGNVLPVGNLPLRKAFFNPSVIAANGGIDPILRGFSGRVEQSVDLLMVDDIRNFLFGAPGQGGLDLAAIDIQRARDHGLADYNTMRQDFGLPKVSTFAQISSDPTIQAQLQQLFGNVDNIDAFVGALAEDHLAGSSVGALTSAIIKDQFTRLRSADRFFYKSDANLSSAEVNAIDGMTFSELIRRNTFVRNIQDNAFIAGTINIGATWNQPAGASWVAPLSWSGTVPNAPGAFASFINSPTSTANITLDAPVTLGSMQLGNANTVSISAGAGGSLNFDNLGSKAGIIISAGSHGVSANAVLTDSLTVLYQGVGSLALSGSISEGNANRSITIDGSSIGPQGGGVTSISGANSFTGGVAVTHTLINLSHSNAQGALGSVATAQDNGEIVLGFIPTASHAFNAGDLGAIRGDSAQFTALTSGGNLQLANGAIIVRQTPGGALPAGLSNGGTLYSAYTTNVSGANASITIGANSATPFKGIAADRQSSYTWGTAADNLTLAGNADLVAIGASTLTVVAKVIGGQATDTLAKRGTGAVKLTNPLNNFAAGTIAVQNGTLQLAIGAPTTFSASQTFSISQGGTLAFNDGFSTTINSSVINNGCIVKPAGTTSQLVFSGAALTGSGTLVAQDTQLSNSGPPNFVQATTASIQAHAILFNNGKTNFVGGFGGVDPVSSSPILAIDGPGSIVHLTGTWDGDGTAENSWLVPTHGGKFVVDAGAQLDTSGDSTTGTILRPFVARGDGTGTVEFMDGFVANQRDDLPGRVEFYTLSLGNITWITNNSLNLPDSNIEVNDESGGTWRVQTHDHYVTCGLTTSKNFTLDTQANLTLAKDTSWAGIDGTRTVNKIGGGTWTVLGENEIDAGFGKRLLCAAGLTININAGKFVEMTDLGSGATATGANGVFGLPGRPDADDVITTDYRVNLNINNAAAEFNASQHLLSLKLNNGGNAILKDSTYNAGAHTVLIARNLGTDSGAGTLNILAGDSATASQTFAAGPSATFNKTGAGTLFINGSTNLGSSAAMNLQGGTTSITLPAGSTASVGTSTPAVTVNSGAALIVNAASNDPFSDDLIPANRAAITNNGTFGVSAGSVALASVDGSGSTTLGGSTTTTADRIRQGFLNVTTNAALTLRAGGGFTNTSKVNSLLIAGGATPTGKIDLADHDFIWDYTGASPATTLRTDLRAGYNNGLWTGKGITSSSAATNSQLMLGYLDNTAQQFASFGGLSVDNTSLLVLLTFGGDANLDGKVNTLDFNSLAGAFGQSGQFWVNGDFNYDSTVNSLDFNQFIASYGNSMAVGGPTLGAVVPEPSLISLLAGVQILRRRRR